MFRFVLSIAWAVKTGIALGMLISQCRGQDGIDPITGQYVATMPEVQVAIADVPELIVFSSPSCTPCKTAVAALSNAQADDILPFRVFVVEDPKGIPDWVTTYPTLYWGNHNRVSDSSKTWKITGWTSVKDVVARFELTRKPPQKPLSREVQIAASQGFYDTIARFYPSQWTETALGYTSPEHLEYTHRLPRSVIYKYVGNRAALNRLHAFAHESHL